MLGPYLEGKRWRYVRRKADGRSQKSTGFLSEVEAREEMDKVQAGMDGITDVTVDEAIIEYEAYLLSEEDGGAGRAKAVYQTIRKLRTFYTDKDELLEALLAPRFKALYTDLRTRDAPRTKAPYSPNYHRLSLAEAKTFLRWCHGRQYIPEAIVKGAETVKGWGRMRKRKTQPSIDEVRLFLDKAHYLAGQRGQQGAVAALMALMMGLRAGEVISRVAREIDDNGTRLLIAERLDAATREVQWQAKTVDSEGYMDIPEELQPYVGDMKAMAAHRDASIWSKRHATGWVRQWVKRICKAVGIPQYTAHDMRRAAGTAAMLGGLQEAKARAVAQLRHSSWAVSGGGSYVAQTAIGRVAQGAALKVWRGGKA